MCMRLLLPALLSFAFTVSANTGWEKKFSYSKAFVENKGQFKLRQPCGADSEVLFSYHKGGTNIYFTKSGVSFSFLESMTYKEYERKMEKEPEKHEREGGFNKEEWEREAREREGYEGEESFESIEEWREEEKREKADVVTRDDRSFYWEGANQNVSVIPEGELQEYFSYSVSADTGVKDLNYVKGFRKLTYKNLYPGIDVVYEFHPDDGLKYSIVAHPGADVSRIKMVYSGEIKKENGRMLIPTLFGNIIDHAPLTFYETNRENVIPSGFKKSGKTVSFQLDNYDRSKTIVIDPWTQTPVFATNWDCVWECDRDGAGNVYIIGGVTPMQLLKYNSAGILQWTHNTPYDTTSWLGTFAVDNAGNSYVTLGSNAAVQKVNTNGGLVWNNGSPGGIFTLTEFWNIAFNCDETKLVIAGTGGVFFPQPLIYNVNMASGNVLGNVQVTGGGIQPAQEVRSITACYNSKYYYLTHDSIGYIDDDFSVCPNASEPFHVNNGYSLSYKCEDWRKNNTGIMAIRYYGGFIYTHRGNQVHKRNFNTAAIIATANIPGGGFATSAFGNSVENSGIDIDDCGNVYVGSKNAVIKYDQNLTQLASYPTSFIVYDVKVSTGGDVIACGSTGNSSSSSRTGSVQSIAAGACAPLPFICCNPSFCPDTFCTTDAPVNLVASTPGGTWSGPGITNAGTGTFSPSVAGPGVHTIIYTLACGSDSNQIVVNLCASIDACRHANGNLTASGGDGGPYTFQQPGYVQNCGTCSGFPFPPCTFPPGCAVSTLAWNNFATGTTATPPPAADTVRIIDGNGNELIINDVLTLQPCPSCDATITPAGPFCQNDVPATLTAAQPGGTWSGTGITNAATGTFSPSVAGAGSWTITYTLTCGDLDTVIITVNALDNAGFSYNPSAYCLTDADPAPAISGLAGGTFTISGGGTINSSSGVINLAATGSGTFTVTYTTGGACPNSSADTIVINASTDATITPAGPFCENAAAVVLTAADAGGTWSGTGITNASTGAFSPTVAGAGNWTITYAITGSCGNSDTTTIIVNAMDDASFSYSSGAYCFTDADPTPAITGTAGGVFSISNGGTINSSTGTIDITATGAGVFTVTYTTGGSCPDTASFSVTIAAAFDATINPAGPYCENDAAVNLSAASAGGTWSGTGITNSALGTFSPGVAGAGAWTITYSISGSCGDTATASIVVNAAEDASFSYPSSTYCLTDADPTPTVSGTSGGIFTISGSGTINANTGQINLAATGAGSFSITYATAGFCPDTQVVSLVISNAFDATISPAGPFCDNDAPVTLTAIDAGGIWSGTGITNTTTGIFDPATAGAGIFQIVYAISGSCGDADSISITVNASPSITVASDQTVCQGETVTLTAASSQPFTWSTGETTSSIQVTPAATTTYTAQAVNSCGTAIDSATVTVTPFPLATITPADSTTITQGASAQLNASGGNSYLWFPTNDLSCTTCNNPYASPLTSTVYCAEVSNGACADTACIVVEVIREPDYYAPGAFSPNNDGVNDFFSVLGDAGAVSHVEVRIFNRWGEEVFYSEDIAIVGNTKNNSRGWDGTYKDTPVDIGVFAYYAKIALVSGNTKTLEGNVTVVR